MERRELVAGTLSGYHPEIGRWLWALADVRRRFKRDLQGVTQAELDFQPPDSNGAGTLLYHIAGVEADWLYVDVLGAEFPPEVTTLFPQDLTAAGGRLIAMTGESLAAHLQRLDAVRALLLQAFTGMSVDDWRRPREFPDRIVSPEWVIYHLVEHEAQHRGQVLALLGALRRRA